MKSLIKFFIIVPVGFFILVALKISYEFISTQYHFYKEDSKASFFNMKNNQLCNSILEKYKPLSKLPPRETYWEIPGLFMDGFSNACWNKSKACWDAVYKMIWAQSDLYELIPLDEFNNPDYFTKWSYADRSIYEEKRYNADTKLFNAKKAFQNDCKRTLLSRLLDKFR